MIERDFKILFVHGYTASSRLDFYPALIPLLDVSGIECVVPDLPGDKQPHAEEWLNTLHNAIIKNTKPLVIVGHSLGTRTTLLYIERFLPQVKALFLIAAFANRVENALRRGGNKYPDFFTHKIDLKKVKSRIQKSYVLHSKDDSSIAYEQGVEMARDLNAELITFTDRGHFSSSKNAPYIFRTLKDKLCF